MLAALPLADPEHGTLSGIVDLDRYPIEAAPGCDNDEAAALVESVRRALAGDGLAVLPGFLRPDALTTAAAEVRSLVPHASVGCRVGSVYQRDGLGSGGIDDPLASAQVRLAGHVTRDMLAPFGVAQRLYVSRGLKRFLAACLGRDRVYEYADPLAGLVATVLPPGGCYAWHYDTNEFVVTIMTQAPDGGGRFEYVNRLRSPGDENLDGLADVLAGDRAGLVRSVGLHPGDLQLFLGRYSLHRVTEVVGTSDRHVLVLSYADRPGVIGPVDRTRALYGRVTEAHLLAEQAAVSASDGLIL